MWIWKEEAAEKKGGNGKQDGSKGQKVEIEEESWKGTEKARVGT